jgi:hypothetical protein
MEICVEKSDISSGELFVLKLAKTLVKSMFLRTFDVCKGSKYQQILQQKN